MGSLILKTLCTESCENRSVWDSGFFQSELLDNKVGGADALLARNVSLRMESGL